MPLIQVYRCCHCRRYFEQKENYLAHLKPIARESLVDKILNKRIKETLVHIRRINNIKEIEVELPEIIVNFAKRVYGFDDKGLPAEAHLRFEFRGMRFDPLCSNSHNCPEGGVTNWWCNDKTLPTGYPGYRGTVIVKRSKELDAVTELGFSGKHYKEFGLKFGSGSGSSNNEGMFANISRHEVTLFCDDWPLVRFTENLLA